MRVSAIAATLLFVPVAGLAPTAFADPILPQNDAGCGCDAPDVPNPALDVSGVNTFTGELLATWFTGLGLGEPQPVGDREDWYGFHAAAGDVINVRVIEVDGNAGDFSSYQLWTPGGTIAYSQLWNLPANDVVAAETGMWMIRVLTIRHGSPYQVEYAVGESEADISGAFTNVGMMVFGFDVGSGATVTQTTHIYAFRDRGVPMGGAGFRFKDDGSVPFGGGAVQAGTDVYGAEMYLGETLLPGPVHVAAQHRFEEDWSMQTIQGGGVLFGDPIPPGRWYAAHVGYGARSYADYSFDLEGDVTFLGVYAVPLEEMQVFRDSDFRGTVLVRAEGVVAAVDASVQAHARGFMVGVLVCAWGEGSEKCSIEDPAGGVSPVSNSVGFAAGPIPGAWTFALDQYAGVLHPESILVYAADVELPTGEQDCSRPGYHLAKGHAHAGPHGDARGHENHCAERS